jgi:uncharacterized protein DUF6188
MAQHSEDSVRLVEAPDRWIFPVADQDVTRIVIDYALGIGVDSGVHFRIECPFEFTEMGVIRTIDPETTTELGPFATLFRAVMKTAYALKDGHLVLEFSDGRTIRVAPCDLFEAWHATYGLGPLESGFEVVALPSGGLAIF